MHLYSTYSHTPNLPLGHFGVFTSIFEVSWFSNPFVASLELLSKDQIGEFHAITATFTIKNALGKTDFEVSEVHSAQLDGELRLANWICHLDPKLYDKNISVYKFEWSAVLQWHESSSVRPYIHNFLEWQVELQYIFEADDTMNCYDMFKHLALLRRCW